MGDLRSRDAALAGSVGFRLGVDFGTSNTVAMVGWPDGRVRPLVFDGSELLSSAVCRGVDGELLVGRDAWRAARVLPQGLEPNPKRTVDDGSVLLDGVEIPVVELFAAVLRRVRDEATRLAGGVVDEVVLTVPAGWGPRRCGVLTQAARAVGWRAPALVVEPVAAASYFALASAQSTGVGACVLVYDLGAGTFDATVVRRGTAGFEVLATVGLPNTGGLDIDAAVMAHLGGIYQQRDTDRWRRLTDPADVAECRAARLLWDDVRAGKEHLSRSASTFVYVPLFDDEALLSRAEFEQLARPVIDRTVATCVAALRAASLTGRDLAALVLVGGSSRIPLVATLLHRAFGLPPTAVERPELVVAEGCLTARTAIVATASPPVTDLEMIEANVTAAMASANRSTAEPATALLGTMTDAAEASAVEAFAAVPGAPAGPRPRRRWVLVQAASTVVLVVAVVAGVIALGGDGATPSTPQVTQSSDVARVSPHAVIGPTGSLDAAAFSPDGALLATGGADGMLRLWDVATGASIAVLTRQVTGIVTPSPSSPWPQVPPSRPASTSPIPVVSVAFTPDGTSVVAGGADGGVRVWNLTTRQRRTLLAGSDDGYARSVCLAVGPDGTRVALAVDYDLMFVDLTTGQVLDSEDRGSFGLIHGVDYLSDGQTLVMLHGSVIALWFLFGNQPRATFQGIGYAVSANRRVLATAGGMVRTYDLSSSQPDSRPIGTMRSNATVVAISPRGRIVATAELSAAGTVLLWDPHTGKALATLAGDAQIRPGVTSGPATSSGPPGPYRLLVFSPDGKRVAGLGGAGLVVWTLPANLTDSPR